jgi:hypothetical protein
MRKVHINGQVYQYKVGKGSTRIILPNGTTTHAFNHTIKGVTPDTFDRGQWKRTSDGSVTPAEVKAYIEREMLKPEPYFVEVKPPASN